MGDAREVVCCKHTGSGGGGTRLSIATKHTAVYDSSARRIPLLYELGELFRYRFLISNLVARDLKIRYKRSSIGFVWVMLNPLLMMLVLTIVFSQVFRFKIEHYAVYVLIGQLLWTLYAQASNAAMSSLQGGGAILRKLYVPPAVFVASAVGSALVNFVFALLPLFAICLLDGLHPSLSWLFVVVPILLITVFTTGVGLIVGGLVVFFHDTFEIYQVLVQVYYFLTPIFYPVSSLHDLLIYERFSPMFAFIDTFRTAVIAEQFPRLADLAPATALTLIIFLVGWVMFTRLEDQFAYHF